MNINYINGIVVGYFLANWAIILNLLAHNKIGIIFAVTSMASAYFLETVRIMDSSYLTDMAEKLLVASMILSMFLSYVSWLSH